MKNVTQSFIEDIKTYGRQFNFNVTIDNETVSDDNINYIKPSFYTSNENNQTKLFTTIMQQLKIDTKYQLEINSKIEIEAGVKVNEPTYQYISYNPYKVYSCEKQEDTNSYVSLAYDKMVESMVDYDLELSTKITVRNYLIAICNRLGWNTEHIPLTFINYNKLIDPTLHQGTDYTFRMVLDEIATITCSFLLFKDEDFYLIYPTETNQIIDNSFLDEDNVTIGERYFINSLVFSRVEGSDSIYRKDDESIEENGLHEFKISDNQLLSTNDRDLYIDEMFDYLKTFEFYTFDVQSKGILFLEACDRFTFSLSGNTYSTILLNNEQEFEDGLTENLYVDKPDETETEYKYADTTDKKINKTYLMVDKQNQLIQSLVSVTTELTENTSLLSAEMQTKLEELGQALTDYQATVSTQFSQTNTSFEMQFNELITRLANDESSTNEEFANISKYIRFENGNIILGEANNPLTLTIQNDRISYQQNGSEVAYFSNNKLYVTTLEVLESLKLGNFAFTPRANGSLTFGKVV